VASFWWQTFASDREAPSWEHYHPAIEEKFTLLRGRLAVRVSGRLGELKPGDVLIVPAGMPHEWWNPGQEDAWIRAEVRPAARFTP
jgi:quercetin dioxygenase-like cupin family protein